MRRATALAVILWVGLAGLACAEAPMTSLRPKANPGFAALPPVVTTTTENTARPGALRPRPRPMLPQAALPSVATVTTENVAVPGALRPRPRPAGLAPQAPLRVEVTVAEAGAATLRPMPRPAGLSAAPVETIAAAAPAAQEERRNGGLFGGLFGGNKKPPRSTAPIAGSVCGDPAIRGEDIARITSKVRGCGVEEPVRVTAIDGIRLNSPATIDCNTATALRSWIDEGLRPAFRGPEVVELRIAASYICRPRNNVRGAKISEHGRGNAIDISGFILSNGRELSVASDYNRTIRRAHKAACGIFGTTLGPGSDGYHEDHLHFDTANLDRPYCR